jgi:hypothetical protein
MSTYPYGMTQKAWDSFRIRAHQLLDTKSVPGCYLWQGSMTYGHNPVISIESKTRSVRKVLYLREHPDFDDAMYLHDTCGNPSCVNPAHMKVSRFKSKYAEEKFGGKPEREFTAFGETKTITAWLNDPRCVVNRKQMLARLDKLNRGHEWTFEDVVQKQVQARRTNEELLFAEQQPRKRAKRSDATF